MLTDLKPDERMQLMRFVCSFVWADLEVRAQERTFVAQLSAKLGLSDKEQRDVAEWLKTPPRPEDVDPARIPVAHKKLFLDVARQVIASDKEIAPDEAELLSLFQQLLEPGPPSRRV
jgi:hypothetical protein